MNNVKCNVSDLIVGIREMTKRWRARVWRNIKNGEAETIITTWFVVVTPIFAGITMFWLKDDLSLFETLIALCFMGLLGAFALGMAVFMSVVIYDKLSDFASLACALGRAEREKGDQ